MSGALEQVKKQPLRQVKSVKDLLWNDQAKEQLAAVAARHMSAERMTRVVANAIRTTPKLQQCEPLSFLGALMQCAALGLEPNTILGHAYLIPFDKKAKNEKTGKWEVVATEVQVVIGYKGLIDLARRSGHIASIAAGIHYSDDDLWDYEQGTEARLRHRNGDMQGKKLHAYAIAKFKDGGHHYVVLPWSHVMKIRDGSQGYQTAIRYGKKDTPWIAYEDEMAKKTAIRALAKYLPLSVEFVDAMSADEARMDYRGFAMDPSIGVAAQEDDFIEGEAVEQEQDQPAQDDPKAEERDPAKELLKQAEAKKAEQAKERARAEAEAKKAEAKAKAEQEAKAAAKKAEADAEAEEQGGLDLAGGEEKPDLLEASPVAMTILRDIGDIGWDAASDFYGKQLDQMKDEKPALYAALLAEARNLDSTAPDE